MCRTESHRIYRQGLLNGINKLTAFTANKPFKVKLYHNVREVCISGSNNKLGLPTITSIYGQSLPYRDNTKTLEHIAIGVILTMFGSYKAFIESTYIYKTMVAFNREYFISLKLKGVARDVYNVRVENGNILISEESFEDSTTLRRFAVALFALEFAC